MGFRFRKTVKLMPGVRLNISKSGVSTSVGRRGATMNFSKRGVRSTVGLPGTGLSYSKMVAKPGQVAQSRPWDLTPKQQAILAWRRPNEARLLRDIFSRKRRGRRSFLLGSLAIFAVMIVALSMLLPEPPSSDLLARNPDLNAITLGLTGAWLVAEISLASQRFRDIGWHPAVALVVMLGLGPLFWPVFALGLLALCFWPPKRAFPPPVPEAPPSPPPIPDLAPGPGHTLH